MVQKNINYFIEKKLFIELVSHQLKQTTSLFGEVLYSENDDNQCIFCRSFHSGQCNSLAYSVKINSVEGELE